MVYFIADHQSEKETVAYLIRIGIIQGTEKIVCVKSSRALFGTWRIFKVSPASKPNLPTGPGVNVLGLYDQRSRQNILKALGAQGIHLAIVVDAYEISSVKDGKTVVWLSDGDGQAWIWFRSGS